jgi:hypothetical protein
VTHIPQFYKVAPAGLGTTNILPLLLLVLFPIAEFSACAIMLLICPTSNKLFSCYFYKRPPNQLWFLPSAYNAVEKRHGKKMRILDDKELGGGRRGGPQNERVVKEVSNRNPQTLCMQIFHGIVQRFARRIGHV